MSTDTGIQWTDATCTACGEKKPAEAFPIDRSRARGRGYVCHDCRNAKARASYVRRGRPVERGWLAPARDGDKRQARRRVNYLVEQGRIPHPNDLPCVDCGDMLGGVSPRHEYDHAKGYGADHQLYVEPVCTTCHHNREEARRGYAA